MARKKSLFILVTAFIFMALVITGCRQSYAPMEDGESLATPTVEGAFPEELPEDMEGVFEAGSQTATAQAAGLGADAPTAVPVVEEDATLEPAAETNDGAEDTPTEAVTEEAPTEETTPPTATVTSPVLDPTETPVPTTAPVDTSSLPSSYTLKQGEFPYCIARRYNVDPTELLNLNGISSAEARVLSAGITLKIPTTGNPFPYDRALNTHPVTYVVPETTTVYGIACFFGDVDPAKIVSLNSISNPNQVPAGTSLQIP